MKLVPGWNLEGSKEEARSAPEAGSCKELILGVEDARCKEYAKRPVAISHSPVTEVNKLPEEKGCGSATASFRALLKVVGRSSLWSTVTEPSTVVDLTDKG